MMRPDRATRIVDVGCGPLGLRAFAPDLDVTGVDVQDRPDYPGPFVRADATERLPFEDWAFDLAYSNSLIEHLPPAIAACVRAGRQARGAAMVGPDQPRSVSRSSRMRSYRQHTGCPRRSGGATGGSGSPATGKRSACCGAPNWLELFGEPVIAERLGPLAKSWIAVRA